MAPLIEDPPMPLMALPIEFIAPPPIPLTAPPREEPGLISSSSSFSRSTFCASDRAMITSILCPSSVISALLAEVDRAEATCI